MRRTTKTAQDLATRVGVGDHAAFRRLYAAFAPDTLTAVQVGLPDLAQSMHVVRATFCEVWRMCAFDVRCGTAPHDMTTWIAAIAGRRGEERRLALELIEASVPPRSEAAFWTELLAEQDRWTCFELASMLKGHDHITLAAGR